MFPAPLNALAARLINHLLQAASWATERLSTHAGQSFLVRAPLGEMHLQVAAGGWLEAAPADLAPAARITLGVGQWLRLLARDTSALKEASVEGDAALTDALLHVAEHLQWDHEEDLSRVVGDIAAHRIALGLRQAQSWRKDTTQRTAETFKEYLTEEKRVIAKREAIDAFTRQVQRLREDVERLGQRIDKL